MLVGSNGSGDLVFLTWLPDDSQAELGTSIVDAYDQLLGQIELFGVLPLQERIFCNLTAVDAIAAARARSASGTIVSDVPPTFIEGMPCLGGPVAGIHIVAARQAGTRPAGVISWRNVPCGRRVEGRDAVYFGLSDIGRLLGAPGGTSAAEETRDTLLLAARVLEAERCSFADVCRTWFFLDDILSWYDEFNVARNAVFSDLGLLNGSRPGIIPASTGIHGRNPRGHRCTLDLLAVQPHPGRRLSIETLHNPLQNEAPEYGSAFSRGLTVATDHSRIFLVSGTAAIDEGGATVHPDDFDGQALRTLDNIESLLASRGAGMNDICQATAFVKRREDVGRLGSILSRRGLDHLPMVCTIDDICRRDLLVEVDATAVIPLRPPADV